MMWSGVAVQWLRAWDELMGRRMAGPHRVGDVYVHETGARRRASRFARGEIEIDERTRPWEIDSSLRALLK